MLWKATLPGSVQGDIRIGDTDGDGRRDDLVVAADSAAAVVDARTGKVRETIDGKGQFVRSVSVADLDRDGDEEILVPTDAVRAYSGGGRALWTYAPAPGLVFSDLAVAEGKVLGSYQTRGVNDGTAVVGGTALDARTGKALWSADPTWTGDADTTVYAAQLFHGVYASPGIPYADGHAVVYSWIVREGANWSTYFEFRDVRTGEVVHTATGGGAWTLGNWFTGDEGLVLAGTASLRTFAKDGQEHEIYTLPMLRNARFGTGPGGRRLRSSAAPRARPTCGTRPSSPRATTTRTTWPSWAATRPRTWSSRTSTATAWTRSSASARTTRATTGRSNCPAGATCSRTTRSTAW